jgi:L-lactate utilization protein LutC
MLSKEQQGELREWRKNKKGKGSNDPSKTRANKFDREKAIASAVEKKFAAKMKSIAQEKTTEDEAEAFIMSIVQKYNGKKVQVSDATAKAEIAKSAPSLKSILKRAKNP